MKLAKVRVEWTPAPHALPLDDLAAQARPRHFLHQGIIYTWTFDVEPISEGQESCYLAIPLDAVTPTRFSGSTLVTPVTPGPLIPLF
jgi:hypothetical protein